jgi:3-deoxy-manno-octulosonate cytidylyltransferase (CMP-KDO synthetase)
MIQWVYEGVRQSRLIDKVIVATDDQRIMEAVEQFGGEAVMTSPAHATGSDRVAEVARKLKAEIIVNVQGDEPLLKGSTIDKAIRPLLKDPAIPLSTLMTRIVEVRDWINPNVVKIVADQKGFALYFSSSPIPFPRDLNVEKLLLFKGKKSPSPPGL